jgi:hypothetical protein
MQVIKSNGDMVHLGLVIIIHEPFNFSLIKIILFLICSGGVISLVVFSFAFSFLCGYNINIGGNLNNYITKLWIFWT